jgi:hypothetical protein
MKYIHYDGSAILTGDAIAEAVAQYAAVLGANGRTDTVHVPTVDWDGASTTATMLLGPASQIVVDDAPDDLLEPDDDGFVQRLRDAAEHVGPASPVNAEPGAADPS